MTGIGTKPNFRLDERIAEIQDGGGLSYENTGFGFSWALSIIMNYQ